VLVIIDALRADKLGCYGSFADVSPELDALAERGVRFEQTIAQCSWTRPSIGSMLTGIYPRTLGLYDAGKERLANRFETLAASATGRRRRSTAPLSTRSARTSPRPTTSSSISWRCTSRRSPCEEWKYFENRDNWGRMNPRELQLMGVTEGGAANDRIASRPDVTKALDAYLESWEREHPKGEPTLLDREISEEEKQLLEALGYAP
jgi:hypothetical protein